MTFAWATFFFPSVLIGAAAIWWLLAYVLRSLRADRTNEVGGLDDLDGLRWGGWTLMKGWLPVTCWRGCADLHRDDWWRAYQRRTCWHGCADLHRDDWWKVYLEKAA